MLQQSQRTLHHNILQDGSRGDVNSAAFRRYDDNCAFESDPSAKVHCTGDRQMIELNYLWNAANALLEVGDLLEVVSELDERSWAKAVGVNLELAMLQ